MVYMIYPGAYIGFEKGGKAVTTTMRLEGPTLRRDGLQGTGCPLSLVKKFLKNRPFGVSRLLFSIFAV